MVAFVSESAICGPVEDAIWSWNAGVVVPRPRFPVEPTKVNWLGIVALPNRMVEDACSPPVSWMMVEVLFTVLPNAVAVVHGNPNVW